MPVLDDAVKSMQARLAEIDKQIGPLAAEADELRSALSRLDAASPAPPTARRDESPRRAGAGARRKPGRGTPTRAPRGQNREVILKSIATEAKTAGQIAKETGIGRGTVATTLTKLVGEGKATKAMRGYHAA